MLMVSVPIFTYQISNLVSPMMEEALA
jgi:hypothetical protein